MTATREQRAEALKLEVIITRASYANRRYSGGKTKDCGMIAPCDDYPTACGMFREFLRGVDVGARAPPRYPHARRRTRVGLSGQSRICCATPVKLGLLRHDDGPIQM